MPGASRPTHTSSTSCQRFSANSTVNNSQEFILPTIPERAIEFHLHFMSIKSSGKNLVDDFAMVEFEAFAAGEFELAGVQAQAAQDCCVDVGHVMTVLDGVETQFVRHTMLDAALNAGAGERRAKALRMMIAPGAFGPGRST